MATEEVRHDTDLGARTCGYIDTSSGVHSPGGRRGNESVCERADYNGSVVNIEFGTTMPVSQQVLVQDHL